MTCQELLRKPTFSWLPCFHFWTVLLQNSNVNRQAIVPTYVLYFHVKNLEYTIYALSSICVFCVFGSVLIQENNFLTVKKNDPFLNYIASLFSMYVCSLPHVSSDWHCSRGGWFCRVVWWQSVFWGLWKVKRSKKLKTSPSLGIICRIRRFIFSIFCPIICYWH